MIVLDIGSTIIISSSLPDGIEASALFSYTLTLNNQGPSAAQDITVSGQWSPEVELVQIAELCRVAGQTFTCTVDSLEPSGSLVLPFTARASSAGGQAVLVATIAASTEDPDLAANRQEHTVQIQPAPAEWRVYLPVLADVAEAREALRRELAASLER